MKKTHRKPILRLCLPGHPCARYLNTENTPARRKAMDKEHIDTAKAYARLASLPFDQYVKSRSDEFGTYKFHHGDASAIRLFFAVDQYQRDQAGAHTCASFSPLNEHYPSAICRKDKNHTGPHESGPMFW